MTDERNTSKLCSECGWKMKSMKRKKSIWNKKKEELEQKMVSVRGIKHCTHNGSITWDRDINAAINIGKKLYDKLSSALFDMDDSDDKDKWFAYWGSRINKQY